MILQHGALILFGPDPQAFPSLVSGVFRFGEVQTNPKVIEAYLGAEHGK